MTDSAPLLRISDPPGRGYTCVGSRLLDEWARNEPHGATEADARVAAACGITRQAVTQWRGGKRPTAKHWTPIQSVTSLDPSVWESWEKLGPDEPEAPAESSTRPIDLPTLQGPPVERLRILEAWCEARTRSGVGLPLDLDRSVKGIQASLRAQIAAKPIPALHEHPDWPTAIEAILDAIEPFEGALAAVLATLRRRAAQQEAA